MTESTIDNKIWYNFSPTDMGGCILLEKIPMYKNGLDRSKLWAIYIAGKSKDYFYQYRKMMEGDDSHVLWVKNLETSIIMLVLIESNLDPEWINKLKNIAATSDRSYYKMSRVCKGERGEEKEKKTSFFFLDTKIFFFFDCVGGIKKDHGLRRIISKDLQSVRFDPLDTQV